MRLNPSVMLIAVIFLLSAIVCPALAYNTNEIDVAVLADGSATITASYNLNWGEYFAYTLMGNRDSIAEGAARKITGQDATVNYITDKQASVTVPKFAKVTETNGVYTYATPKLPYNKAGQYLNEATKDFSIAKAFVPIADSVVPQITKITFPDGYTVTYQKPYPEGFVPSITH
ncbi:MAG: hypothetical protein JXQ82_10095 [Methanomicrobiaceae archaeon]|nr:hypothetical protein [Methanomicrobiaceae archaeon]